MVEPCCKNECLHSRGYEAGVKLVTQCLDELHGLNRKEKKDFMVEKVRRCITGKSKAGYLKFDWTIGTFPGDVHRNVCRRSFRNAYCCGHTFVDDIVSKVKSGDVNHAPVLKDSVAVLPSRFLKCVSDLAASFNLELTPMQLSSLVVPNTVASLTCFAWMHAYFEAVGDKQPNHQEISVGTYFY